MPVVKKSVVKKPAAKRAPENADPIVLEMKQIKETTGTFQFQEEGEKKDQTTFGIYVKKSAMPEGFTPGNIRLMIEFI